MSFPAVLFMAALASANGGHPSMRTEEVSFQSGEVRLAGRLHLPPGDGPHPAVVFTHGSGDGRRDNPRHQLEAEYLARSGIASLLFDKRGSGDSTGDWRKATFEELAQDALAAVRFLRGRPEIDGVRIGLRGASQSGWILPLAAASREVAHLILISPAGVTSYEQIVYDVRTDLEDAGFSPAAVERALAITRSGLEYARRGDGWEAHARALEAARAEPWLEIAAGSPVADHWMWRWIRPLLDFDAVPLLGELDVPVLVVLGEDDRETPSQIAGHRHEQVLRRRGGAFLVRYFPGADHDLRMVRPAAGGDRQPLADGYLETLRDWVLGVPPRPGPPPTD